MNALLILENISNGGAQRVVSTIFPLLDKRIQAELLILTKKIDYPIENADASKIHCLNASRIVFSLPKLVNFLFWKQPKVVFSSIFFSDVLVFFLTRIFAPRAKIILRSCNFYSKAFPNRNGVLAKLVLYSYKRADLVICSTQEMKQDFLQYLPTLESKIVVIHNPINLDMIRKKADEQPCPEVLQDNANFTFICVAKLKAQKNLSLLINAFSHMRDKNVRLLILGKGELLDDLKRLVSALGLSSRIDFLGFQSNPYPYIKHADSLILSSDYEGFPNVILEAMCLNTPVISTNCSSGPAEIISSGVNGLLVPVNDVAALANAMNELFSDAKLRQEITVNALCLVQKYNAKEIASCFSDAFSRV